MPESGIRTAFVIMPFSSTTERHSEAYWTRFFTDFLEPQLTKRDYDCKRSQARPESIVKGVLKQLLDADLVIAVLTDYNANVWYELGIRHSLRKGTIMMIESGQKVPFDIASYGVLVYEDSLAGTKAFESALAEFIDKIEREHPVDSPAQEFLGPWLMDQLEKQRREIERDYQTRIDETIRVPAAPTGTLAGPRRAQSGQPRVLWVDDHPGNNEVLITTYKARGVQFDLALSTEQALEFLGANTGAYSLIISDMRRDGEADAGIRLLGALKERFSNTPPVIVYCTTRAADKYGERAKGLGAVEVTPSARALSLWLEKVIAPDAARASATAS